MDWGAGAYELSAERELAPTSDQVVTLAGIARGARVLDVGCGTGNCALAAARAGAVVTGIDPSPRLLDVARGRACSEGLEIAFAEGDAQALEFADGAFDVTTSVFAVIFAPDGESAVGELVRVTRPAGTVVVTGWDPTGAVSRALGTLRTYLAALDALPPAHPGAIDWGAPAAVAAAFGRHRAATDVHGLEVPFAAASPEALWETFERHHPAALAARAVLEPAGAYGPARAEAIALLHEGNEDATGGFAATSRCFAVRAVTAA